MISVLSAGRITFSNLYVSIVSSIKGIKILMTGMILANNLYAIGIQLESIRSLV